MVKAVEDRIFEALAALLGRAFAAGNMDREAALREFGSEHSSQLLPIEETGRIEALVERANIRESGYWALFVREGALAVDQDWRVAQAWRCRQMPELCVVVGARCALRALPMLNGELIGDEARDAEARFRLVLPSFWAMAGAWLGGTWEDLRGDVGHANLRSRLRDVPNVEAAQAAAHIGETFIDVEFTRVSDDEIPGVVCEAALAAGRALEKVGGAELAAEHRKAFAADMALVVHTAVRDRPQSLHELSLSQLWPGGTPDAVLHNWSGMKTHLLVAGENWQVWTDWYDDRLRGSGACREVELDRVSTAEDLLLDEPAVVNAAIRQKIDTRTVSRFPAWQLLSVNDQTGLFGLAEAEVSDEGVYERVCDQLDDALRPLLDARYSNLYADVSDPVRLLHRTLEQRRDAPLIVHRRLKQVARGIDEAVVKDKVLADDFNVRTVREDLDDAIRAIPEAVPAVADEHAKRSGSSLLGLAREDRAAVSEAATLLAEFAEEPVRELVDEGLAALDEGEVGVPMSQSESERVFLLGWMLAKVPALKRTLAGVATVVADLQRVCTAAANIVHILLKLFH